MLIPGILLMLFIMGIIFTLLLYVLTQVTGINDPNTLAVLLLILGFTIAYFREYQPDFFSHLWYDLDRKMAQWKEQRKLRNESKKKNSKKKGA